MFFVNCNINLFKLSVSLPSMAVYFVFHKKVKTLMDPFMSEDQVALSVHTWSNHDVLRTAQHHCHLLDLQ